MKKVFTILSISVIVISAGIVFFPRRVQNAVIIKSEKSYTQIYVKDKIKKLKKNLNLKPGTSISYYYNLITAFGINTNPPCTERIMCKTKSSFDFELSGNSAISKKNYYYKLDQSGKISLSQNSEIVVGENNIDSYKNSSGEFNVFVIHPFSYSNVRIGISTSSFGSLYHEKVQISSPNSMTLYCVREGYSREISPSENLTVEKLGSEISLTMSGIDKNSKNRFYLKGTAMKLTGIVRGIPNITPSYDGILEFNPTSSGFTIVNEVGIEDYLTKVVPCEMPETGGLESLKSQAIAARTYAINSMRGSTYEDKGFYMDDSSQSQVYNNIKVQPLATEAVSSTKGLILTYNNAPLDAKYYSTSCGAGSDYKNLWFTATGSSQDKPYYKVSSYIDGTKTLPTSENGWSTFFKSQNLSCIDNDSPYFRWKVTYSIPGITKCLNSSLKLLYEKNKNYVTILNSDSKTNGFPTLKGLEDITIKSRGPAGNVKEVYFKFTNATISVQQDTNLRSVFRCSRSFTGENTVILLNDGTGMSGSPFLPSSYFSIAKTKDSVIIYGGGYGHGVGMSQYGAMKMSKNGSSYIDILKYYYKNFKFVNIY